MNTILDHATRLAAWRLVLLGLLGPLAWAAQAQARLERDGVVLYWGLVPAAVVSQQHALADLHGGPPAGKVHHLVVALFDAKTGQRIENAVVQAQLSETGVVDAAPRYLLPMKINEQASYGQLFGMAKDGPYLFRVKVKLPDQPAAIDFTIEARVPHADMR